MRRLLGPRRTRFVAPPVFVEVFSGKGDLAKALRELGCLVIEWDIDFGPEWDLTRPSVAKQLRGWVAGGLVWGLHFGVPCETWTRARDRGPVRTAEQHAGWPGRLRSNQELWGLSALQHPATWRRSTSPTDW